MYNYKLSWGSHEGEIETPLLHETKFSKKAFEKMFLDCVLKAAINKRKKDIEDWEEQRSYYLQLAMESRKEGKEGRYDDYMRDAVFYRYAFSSYEYLYEDTINLMVKDYGFQQLKFVHKLSLFGSADLTSTSGWKYHRHGLTQKASELVSQHVEHIDAYNDPEMIKWEQNRQLLRNIDTITLEQQDKELCEKFGVEYVPLHK